MKVYDEFNSYVNRYTYRKYAHEKRLLIQNVCTSSFVLTSVSESGHIRNLSGGSGYWSGHTDRPSGLRKLPCFLL